MVRLAATLGAKSSLKRLQKRDILSVDVPEACTFLSNPPDQPLALRLSSNLMYGVTRIFSQQYTFFYSKLQSFPVFIFPSLECYQFVHGDVSDLRLYGCVSEERFWTRFWDGEVTVDDVSLLQTRIRRDISINAMAAIILDDFPMKHTPRKYPPLDNPLDNPPLPFRYPSSPHSFIHAPI
jgi:N terminus of Rad21 / Rec8 like protein